VKTYNILKPKNDFYEKVKNRLHGRTCTCDLCKTKSPLLTNKSIVTKDTESQFIHVLNYCPNCQ